MSYQEEFYGTPMFLDLENGDARLGFNESPRIFTLPASDKHFNEWVALLKNAMKDKKKVKVKADKQVIILLE